MSVAKFASLHGDLLARKGKATPATGELHAEPHKDNPEVLFNGHKHAFDAEMPTPVGSHMEMEIPAEIAAPEMEAQIGEAEVRLAPLVVEPEVAIERRQLDQGPPLAQPERRAGEWDGIERRTVDRGLLAGVPERRRPPVFGKRGAVRASLSETSQKRFNA